MNIVELQHIKKTFPSPHGELLILDDVNLCIHKGHAVSITGKSGSGKSTLLHIVGGLDNPTSGSVLLNGTDISTLNDRALSLYRNATLGFIFQAHLLLSDFSALENVMMPALIAKTPQQKAEKRAKELLDLVNLSDRAHHFPDQLSGGEKQRVAICRALMNQPSIILADEPTGSLDEENAHEVESLLVNVVREQQAALLLVTHNQEFAATCDTMYTIHNHCLVEDA